MKKVIIVDDEQAGRQLIKQYLSEFKDLILIGEANNGVDAVKIINEFNPDLIFLDIHMPGLNGFEILPHLNEIPKIIFSTAYDKYALEAFEVHAVDYLLKPYTRDRFTKAIQKVKWDSEVHDLSSLAENLVITKQIFSDKLLVNKNQKLILLNVDEIIRLEAYGDYTKVITSDNVFISSYGISVLLEKLDNQRFIRIHRGDIINLNKIKDIIKHGKTFEVTMINSQKVKVSLSYMDRIKEIMI